MESKIVYFEKREPENTEVTFRIVRERLAGSHIRNLVIASTTGATARKAMEFFKDSGVKLVVIPHQFGYRRRASPLPPGSGNPFPPELVKALRDSGHEVHFSTMLFRTGDLYDSSTPLLMANLLRCFCQGVKVCFEIVLMAADGGLVEVGEKVIAIGGTVRGADTALVMQAASSQNFRRLRVNEILCKPLNPLNHDEVLEEEIAREKGSIPNQDR